MPYISQERRKALSEFDQPRTKGELNYAITKTILRYLTTKGLSYDTIEDIRGAMLGALLEFSRRIADPYEDRKIHENGDVYEPLEAYNNPLYKRRPGPNV